MDEKLKVEKGCIVSIDYRLHLGDGKEVDASSPGEPLLYLHGEGNIVPGLERALEGLGEGESRQVVVQPEMGYGDRDPDGVQKVRRDAFPPGFAPEAGMQLVAQGAEGEAVPFTVREVRDDSVTVDLNHPLAGETLHFDVTVRGVRRASAEELEHGHPHGPDGSHHHD